MLFKVTSNPVRQDNPEIDSIPEFIGLSDRNLKYIFLVYDYKSPYREIPIDKRKERVAANPIVGFRMEKDGKRFDKNARDIFLGNVKSVNNAIAAFKNLQYDEDRETLDSVRQLISNIRDYLRVATGDSLDYERKIKMANNLVKLEQTKKDLALILDIRQDVDQHESSDEEELSTLDKLNQGLL